MIYYNIDTKTPLPQTLFHKGRGEFPFPDARDEGVVFGCCRAVLGISQTQQKYSGTQRHEQIVQRSQG